MRGLCSLMACGNIFAQGLKVVYGNSQRRYETRLEARPLQTEMAASFRLIRLLIFFLNCLARHEHTGLCSLMECGGIFAQGPKAIGQPAAQPELTWSRERSHGIHEDSRALSCFLGVAACLHVRAMHVHTIARTDRPGNLNHGTSPWLLGRFR